MPETTRAQCPGCAANLVDDGYSAVLTCPYCGTRVTVHRPHTPPRPPAPPAPTELDLLRARLAAQERDWYVRIRAAERIGGADVAAPLLACAAIALIVFIIASVNDQPNVDQWWEPLAGCAFWVLGPLVALGIHRLMGRRREKRALVVAGHRDQALAPLRERIAALERPAPPTEKERRIQSLAYARDETRRLLDHAYLAPENVRTTGKADFIIIPGVGCGLWLLFIAVAMTILTNMPDKTVSDNVTVLLFLVPLLILIGVVIALLVWRPLRRRARVRKLEEERDRVAPELVRRLNEIEAELARLTR